MMRSLSGCSAWDSIRDFFDPRISTSSYFADAYECAQYGQIPQPAPPAIRAPQTAEEMTGWTPEQSYNTGADWAQVNVERIQAAEASGAYHPAGALPATATWLYEWRWPLIIAGGALGLLILVKVKP
jgi:hypothetical protein